MNGAVVQNNHTTNACRIAYIEATVDAVGEASRMPWKPCWHCNALLRTLSSGSNMALTVALTLFLLVCCLFCQ